MNEQKVKKRGWVKNAIIIFLVIMLILTFFSNTIMNRSLPEVAAQYVESGTITAKIRGNGTITANEVYSVQAVAGNKVQSVLVHVGDSIEVGTPLAVLVAGADSDISALQEQLEAEELNYQRMVINAADSDYAKENRDIQLAKEALQKAKNELKLLSPVSAEDVKAAKDAVEGYEDLVKSRQKALEQAQAALEAAGGYVPGTDNMDEYEAFVTAERNLNVAIIRYAALKNDLELIAAAQYGSGYSRDELVYTLGTTKVTANDHAEALANNFSDDTSGVTVEEFLTAAELTVTVSDPSVTLDELSTAYFGIVRAARTAADAKYAYEKSDTSDNLALSEAVDSAEAALDAASDALSDAQEAVAKLEQGKLDYEAAVQNVTSCETTLSDLIFALQEQQKGDDKQAQLAALDLKAQLRVIERLREQIKNAGPDAEGGELVAETSGIVKTINVTAGDTTDGVSALMEIEVVDRGYSTTFAVTAEQAQKVAVGDTAELSNYWWGAPITAVLDGIRNDPTNQGQKILHFSLSGEDIQSGTQISLSVGGRSANYDTLVPKSAVHNDNKGDFVYTIVAKSSPLGNRYIATRVDVKILAQDDTKVAVSGGVSPYDYIITTSNRPIEAGMQVRIAENG